MEMLSRRELLGTAVAAGGWMALGVDSAAAQTPGHTGSSPEPYKLPPLPYDYSDLEPHIDAQTMMLHHDIHHAGYVKKANAALAELAAIRGSGADQMGRVRNVTGSLSFNLSGHLLHSIFWNNMTKNGGGNPPADTDIARMLARDFGSADSAWANFAAAASQVQGSGWAVLAWEPNAKQLMVLQAEKHQNLAVWGVVPLLVIDVWEHAYYLKYQNKRSDYVSAFRNLLNWKDVEHRLQAAMQS